MSEVVTKNQSKAMGQRVLQMFSDALNSIADDLEKLPHATIRVFSNAGSTVTATSEDGTVLTATENNGVWEFKVPTFGYWTVKSGNASREVYVNEFKTYPMGVGKQVYRYGYRIREDEPDPYERVEYILDAKGMTPAHMDFENDTFDYGSWANVWFVADNKPLMLKSDGTVGYYLNPNDYSKKADGTASDVANADYDGNAMAQFPLCWIYRYEDDTYKYEIVSNVQWDENYKAYAHTRADGSIANYFYLGLFAMSGSNSKARSLVSSTPLYNIVPATLRSAAKGNGAQYDLVSWSHKELIRTLAILIAKTNRIDWNSPAFGYVDNRNFSSGYLPGEAKDKGQFFGKADTTNSTPVKVFHLENIYGGGYEVLLGYLVNGAAHYIKMTPEGGGYSFSSLAGYVYSGVSAPYQNRSYWLTNSKCTQYGMFLHGYSGSETTYYATRVWWNTNISLSYAHCLTLYSTGAHFYRNETRQDVSARLSCEQPSS